MQLRTKSFLLLTVTSLTLIGGINLTMSRFGMEGYLRVEARRVRLNMDRARLAVDQSIIDLHNHATDWAEWDDAYQFVKDHNQNFVRSNLVPETLRKIPLDLVAFTDAEGHLIQAQPVPRLVNQPPPHIQFLLDRLRLDTRIADLSGSGFQGILRYQDFPIEFTARPIRRSSGSGQARGWIIFARYMDAEAVADIARRTRLQLKLIPLGSAKNSPADLAPPTAQTANGVLIPRGESLIVGRTLIRDIVGTPQFALETYNPRDIYLEGKRGIRNLNLLLSVSALSFSVVVFLVLERFVLSRILSLTKQVEKIGAEAEIETRLSIHGNDEIAALANRANAMLERLWQSARAQKQGEEHLRLYSESLERMVHERTEMLESRNEDLWRAFAEISEKAEVLENALEGIGQVDANGRFETVNGACASLFGVDPESIVGTDWLDVIAPEDRDHVVRTLEEIPASGKVEVEVSGVRHDGTRVFVLITLVPTVDSNGQRTGHHCFMKDISERKALEAKIRYQALHDALTGLPNRLLFMDRMEHALDRMERNPGLSAILFLDLDNFKFVNDTLGHEQGDKLLLTIAERLRQNVRPGDTVARLAGDEFTVLAENLENEAQAIALAERLVSALKEPVRLSTREVFVSASVGVAVSAGRPHTADSMLRDADTAMYEAKTSGKAGYVLFHNAMNDRLQERVALEANLRGAIVNDELQLYYQPIVDLETGNICGAEALVRWIHPHLGLVPPSRFIPIAENTGLIVPLGKWVMHEACRQANEWRERMPSAENFTISVNLSARQLQSPEVVETVSSILHETGLPPALLKLEITESLMVADAEATIERLNSLKSLGVQLAMDDFGTGYSSLSYLQRLPLDNVKIDQSFISRMGDSVQPAAIVLSIIRMCRALHMSITSEGVETAEQLAQLQSLGCDYGQGYFFAKPLVGEAFEQVLLHGKLAEAAVEPQRAWNQEEYIYLAA